MSSGRDQRTAFGRFLRRTPGSTSLQSNSVMAAATIVAAGFIGSRLLGVLRSVAIASAFGTEPELASYWVAFRLPDLVFQLVAGGTVSAAFIPVFSQVVLREGGEAGWRLASRVLNLLFIATLVLAAFAFAFAPLLVPLIAPGLGEGSPRERELNELAVELTRFMLLSPIFFAVSGMLTGVLNARRHFVAPALAPMVYNASIIVGAVALSGPLGVHGLAWGVVIGSLGHLLIQLPVTRWLGMRWSPSIETRSEPVREVMRLMLPRIVGLGATQVNFLVLVFFASFISDAAISAINFAFLIMMLPVGVIGMAISTAAFPVLAQQAASRQMRSLRDSLARTLRSILFLAIPASVALLLLAEPVVRVLFEHGAFDAEATRLVADPLMWFAIGVSAHAAIEILSRGFYALSDTRTPVQIAVVGMILNVILSAVLVSAFELRGLAAAASTAAIFEMSLLVYILRGRVGGFGGSLWRSVIRTLIASLVMGEVVILMRLLMGAAGLEASGSLAALAVLAGAGGAGALSFLAASLVINRAEVMSLLDRRTA